MQLEDIKKLATLARIDMDDAEIKEIANDFGSILAYVGQVQEISGMLNADTSSKANTASALINVMREDVVTNEEGSYSLKIIKEMPDTENGFLKVKQIL